MVQPCKQFIHEQLSRELKLNKNKTALFFLRQKITQDFTESQANLSKDGTAAIAYHAQFTGAGSEECLFLPDLSKMWKKS